LVGAYFIFVFLQKEVLAGQGSFEQLSIFRAGIFLWGQWFLPLTVNEKKRVLGVESGCSHLKQFAGDCICH
jgi:hypothetical protein